ncbi:class B sortase [uncultured Eubacterium sp.]|uniref:class B sortase n=1 Tax=uncultured Eubacterium sp. TaxID=165185 RepID=UPI0025D3F172|nr:class B sortase [uncultured Eubacterium sp.]
MVLAVIFAASTFFIIQYYKTYDTEQEVFEVIAEEYENTDNETSNSEDNGLSALYEQNNDLIGWIRIDGTNINYPVMLGEYYLKHNFNKQYSDYGVPFVIGGITDNTIIYGHNMKTRTMFYDLTRYSNSEFYKKHKYIEFSTLDSKSTYEIVYAFKTIAYSNQGFDYTKYSSFSTPDDFDIFTEKCSSLALYDTETNTKYGDKLITLSTCEYSRNNGRFVVVAKEVV